MAEVTVWIVDLNTQERKQFALPADEEVSRILPAIAEQFNAKSMEGGTVEYKLTYKGPEKPFEFLDTDTLAGKKVADNATLGFSHEFIAG